MDSHTPIIQNFSASCLSDIQSKLNFLPSVRAEAIQNINDQAALRIEYVSKVFLDLEDLVVKLLRSRIKDLYEF